MLNKLRKIIVVAASLVTYAVLCVVSAVVAIFMFAFTIVSAAYSCLFSAFVFTPIRLVSRLLAKYTPAARSNDEVFNEGLCVFVSLLLVAPGGTAASILAVLFWLIIGEWVYDKCVEILARYETAGDLCVL